MNVKLLRKIQAWLLDENRKERFYMASWFVQNHEDEEFRADPVTVEDGHWCGTACCIAGSALLLDDPNVADRIAHTTVYPTPEYMEEWRYKSDTAEGNPGIDIIDAAADLLGLGHNRLRLFIPSIIDEDSNLIVPLENITPLLAHRVIENLINTGKVGWDTAIAQLQAEGKEPLVPMAEPEEEPEDEEE